MRFFAGMFFAASHFTREMKEAVRKASGEGGAGFRKNRMTVGVARGLLLAHALAYKAKGDIAYFSRRM
jgi:hypothetical protein